MNPKAQELLGEIRQLMVQYRREVPSGRRAWPESIKSRVRAVFASGMPVKEIAAESKLSYYTLIEWIPPDQRRRYRPRKEAPSEGGQFKALEVRPATALATVTVAKTPAPRVSHRPSPQIATVTVTLPGGIRLDGVTPEFMRAWIGKGGNP